MFVKPANWGRASAWAGLGIVRLEAALAEAARYDRKLLIEAAVPNAREIECGVLGNDEPLASTPGEVVPSNEFYDYAAKYLDGCSELRIPAPITADQAARVRKLAVQAFLALDGAACLG